MASARHDSKRTASAAAALALVACGAQAAESSLTANVGTRVAHSDNVALAAPGSEHGEDIGEVSAGIVFDRIEQRHDTHIAYGAQGVFYNKSRDSNEVFNTLDANSSIAIVLDRLFLDLYAVYDQTIINATQKYSFNKLALTGNRTDVGIVGVSPNIRLDFGENIVGEIRVTKSDADYKDARLEDYKEQVGSFSLANSNARSGGTWGVSYKSEDYDYETTPKVHFETFSAELGWWVGSTVRLFTQQGLESDYTMVGKPGSSPGLDDHFWYFGVDWKPSDRNEITVSSGERSYGEAHTFNWHYHSAYGGLNVGYTEEPSTFLRDQLHSVRQAGEVSPIDTLDGPNGNLFYLQKRADVTFLIERPRSSVGLRAFQDQRFDIVDSVNDVQKQTEEYRGGEVTMSWTVNPRSKLGLSIQDARRQSTVQAVNDDLQYIALLYEHGVGRQGTMTVNLGHERAKPKGFLTGENDYTENQISIGIERWFGSPPTTRAPRRFSGFLNGLGY